MLGRNGDGEMEGMENEKSVSDSPCFNMEGFCQLKDEFMHKLFAKKVNK